MIPLYFLHDGRCLITLFTAAFMLAFFSGFAHLIRHQGAAHEWSGLLADANILVHGSIKRILTALLALTAAFAIRSTRILPNWLALASVALALVNLAFVPSIYFGKDPTAFYSAIGWGNTAMAGSLITYWIIAASIAILRAARVADDLG